jgi:transglutaminase-like putative cysteine protease
MKNNRFYLFSLLAIICLSCSTKPDCNKVISIIQGEFNTGNFEKVVNLSDSLKVFCKDNSGLIIKADSFADLAQRIKLDFNLSEDEAAKQVGTRIGPFSFDEKRIWEEKGWLEYRIIDGRKKYFNRTPSNLRLLRLFHENKTEWIRRNSIDPEKSFRLNHTDSVIKASHGKSTIVKPVNYKVTYSITVKPGVVPEGEMIKCWLPWPRSDQPRQKNIELLETSQGDYFISPDSSIHSTIYMERKAENGVPAVFSLTYKYQSSGQYIYPQNIKAEPYDKNSDLFKKYTAEQPPQIHFSENIRRMADSITGGEENPLLIVRKIYSWFKDNIPWTGALEYSIMPDIPEYVLKNRRGDCGMQTLLFMSMLRYKGIPVRWQSGWMLPEEGWTMHDWCEIYYEGTGWVPVDVTYDLQITKDPALRDFFMSGFDSYRLIINDGISGTLYPEKRFRRSEPYDFQRGEVEWSGGNLYFDKWKYELKFEYLR